MKVEAAIARAEELLPGNAAPDGEVDLRCSREKKKLSNTDTKSGFAPSLQPSLSRSEFHF